MKPTIIHSIDEWQAIRKTLKRSIGFVPTMGNLHAGHASLMQRACEENEISVLSIFVNPTQFNEQNDLVNYPRTLDADMVLAEQYGIDYVLIPEFDALYPKHYRYQVTETEFSRHLCGKSRPGHFTGMLTVVLKLLMLVKPDRAYFGEKDYQQLQLVKDMVEAFFLDVAIIACPIVREASGLALSSRNNRLSEAEKALAPMFHELLNSDRDIVTIKQALSAAGFSVDYIEEYNNRRFGAVYLGDVRLIDNVG